VLYNVLFVVPLMVVFAVTYFGIKSERLTAVFQTHAGAVKLVTAALFGVLCVWLAVLLL
jgi:spore maturation protein SpmA